MTAVRFAVPGPLGEMIAVCVEGALAGLDFSDRAERMTRLLARAPWFGALRDGAAEPAVQEALEAYFDGDVAALDTVRAEPFGTPFERSVWEALRRIPAGETRAYSDIARAVGRPTAARAVGRANGRNPVSLVIPCHRVIGAGGGLTGYAGGLERKGWLLRHEGVLMV